MSNLLKVRGPEGIIHIPYQDITRIVKRADGTGQIFVASQLEPVVTVKSADSAIAAFDTWLEPPVEQHAPASVFEAIFGKQAGS